MTSIINTVNANRSGSIVPNHQTVAVESITNELAILANKARAQSHKLGPNYHHVDTGDILDALEPLIGDDAEVLLHAPRHNVKSTKHLVEIRLPKFATELYDSRCIPRILLGNSYLGETRLFELFGLYRSICANGLIIGDTMYSMSAQHRNGPTLRQKLDSIVANTQATIDYVSSGEYARDITFATSAPVSTRQSLDIIRNLKIPERAKLKATFLYSHQDLIRDEDKTGNVWSLFNIVNECIRKSSKTVLASENTNVGLLQQIQKLAG